MPSGGVPIYMLLRPKKGKGHLIYCHGAELKVFSQVEWEMSKSNGEPILALDKQEALLVERFLRYWLTDDGDGPIYQQRGTDVSYDC